MRPPTGGGHSVREVPCDGGRAEGQHPSAHKRWRSPSPSQAPTLDPFIEGIYGGPAGCPPHPDANTAALETGRRQKADVMIWLSAHNGASFIELVLPPDETPQDTRYKRGRNNHLAMAAQSEPLPHADLNLCKFHTISHLLTSSSALCEAQRVQLPVLCML